MNRQNIDELTNLLRKIRLRKKLTVRALAKQLYCSYTSISLYENGLQKPKLSFVDKLERYTIDTEFYNKKALNAIRSKIIELRKSDKVSKKT